jgi:histone acetyltransferase (RNA polymerase elongator complex component)
MIIPIFIMNKGCPHRCLFCNERLTAQNHPNRLEEAGFQETVRAYLRGGRRKSGPVQIAFYGGTFTGMPRDEQRRLLELAGFFLREGTVDDIRISTRPDEIKAEGLDLIKGFGVRTVEIGAQSLDDEVLLLSRRGHTAADTLHAVSLLKEWGFAMGIHLMAGLPGDSPERFAETIDKVIALSPDMVRIHPTIVLRDTPLADAFWEGSYAPLSLSEAVSQCKNALKKLTAAGIAVIRMGLQTTRELEEPGAVVAGPFHPAFRSHVESAIFFEMAAALCESAGWGENNPKRHTDHLPAIASEDNLATALSSAFIRGKSLTFTVSPADVSHLKGPQKENITALKARFNLADIRITADPSLPRRTLILTEGNRQVKTDWSGQIIEFHREDMAGLKPDASRKKSLFPSPGGRGLRGGGNNMLGYDRLPPQP